MILILNNRSEIEQWLFKYLGTNEPITEFEQHYAGSSSLNTLILHNNIDKNMVILLNRSESPPHRLWRGWVVHSKEIVLDGTLLIQIRSMKHWTL